MKVIKWIFKKVLDILTGCFYLFSAFTLFVTVAVIIAVAIGFLNISGKTQDIILWGYVAFVGIYFVAKIALWVVKFYKKMVGMWNKHFRNPNVSDEPILPSQ